MKGLLIVGLMMNLAFAGNGSGNGGDAIKCDDGKLYSLDYLHPFSLEKSLDFFKDAKHSDEVLTKIAWRLESIDEDLATSLKLFLASRYKRTEFRNWKGGEEYPELEDYLVNDEHYIRSLKSCLGDTSEVVFNQVVVRYENSWLSTKYGAPMSGFVEYEYDINDFKELEQNHPMQLSMMMIHEWLRDYFNKSRNLQNINRYMHTSEFFTNSKDSVRNYLLQEGLKVRKITDDLVNKTTIRAILVDGRFDIRDEYDVLEKNPNFYVLNSKDRTFKKYNEFLKLDKDQRSEYAPISAAMYLHLNDSVIDEDDFNFNPGFSISSHSVPVNILTARGIQYHRMNGNKFNWFTPEISSMSTSTYRGANMVDNLWSDNFDTNLQILKDYKATLEYNIERMDGLDDFIRNLNEMTRFVQQYRNEVSYYGSLDKFFEKIKGRYEYKIKRSKEFLEDQSIFSKTGETLWNLYDDTELNKYEKTALAIEEFSKNIEEIDELKAYYQELVTWMEGQVDKVNSLLNTKFADHHVYRITNYNIGPFANPYEFAETLAKHFSEVIESTPTSALAIAEKKIAFDLYKVFFKRFSFYMSEESKMAIRNQMENEGFSVVEKEGRLPCFMNGQDKECKLSSLGKYDSSDQFLIYKY